MPEDDNLPPGYEVDPALAPWWQRKLPAIPAAAEGPRLRQIRDAIVLPNGLVCQGRRILECSSLSGRLTPARVLEAAALLDDDGKFESIPEALLIARATNDQGTFGDYAIEFLLPFAWISHKQRGPYLLDADFVRRHAPEDLGAKQCSWMEIPRPGLRVERLTVAGPCQDWDDFLAANIERLRAHFGIFPDTQPGKKIFFSRLGWKAEPGTKQSRSIANEEEVAGFLGSLGFEILRADISPDNARVREAVRSADVVVATHGAAMTHLMFARPSTVIELASVAWWVPCYLKMCRALQVSSYTALAARPDGAIDLQALASALRRKESAPRVAPLGGNVFPGLPA